MKAIPGSGPTIGLLRVFNIFMTFARYSQLTVSSAPLAAVILVSRGSRCMKLFCLKLF
jgi:uncharacterized protein (DUF486 family)